MSEYELRYINGSTGVLGGWLSEYQKLTVNTPFNDIGSLELEYPGSSDGVPEDFELAVTLNGVEIEGGRFLLQDDEGDQVAEEGVITKYVGRSAVAVWLEDAIVYPPTGSTTKAAPSTFTNATPGTIMATLLLRAQTRGTSTLINYSSFTSSVDSAGNAWAKVLTIEYETGVGVLQVLQNLIEQGVVEVRFDKRQLHLYNPGGIGTDRTVQAVPIVLRKGRDIKEAPVKRSTRDLANVTLVGGDDDVLVQRTDATSLAARRRRETFVSQGGVTDTGTLAIVGDTQLSYRADRKVQKTVGLQYTPESPKPWSAYFNGDYVWADVNNYLEKFRVRQIILTQGVTEAETELTVVLNDRLAEREITQARAITGITGGATLGGGNSVPADNSQTTDTLAPAAPSAPTLSSTAYLDADGKTQAQMSISWAAVTTNSDATACTDLAGYEVQVARTSGQWTPLGRTEAAVTVAYASPFSPGITAYARVRAFDTNGNAGAWSSAASITTATDNTPPPIPSTPTIDVTTFPGTIRVIWDGLGQSGENFTNALYNDFDRVEVHASLVNGFTPTSATRIDTLRSRLGGVSSFSSSPLGPTYIKLVSVDNLGNTSAASTQTSGTTSKVGAADLTAQFGGFNLLYNSGFDNTTSYLADWSVSGTASRETATIRSGVAALKFTKTGGVLQILQGSGRNQRAFDVGDKVTVSAKVRRSSTAANIKINLYGAVDLPSVNAVGGANVWERIYATYTIGTAGTYWPRVYSDDSGNADIFIDDVQMEYGDVPTAWAPRAEELLPGVVGPTELADLAVISSKLSSGAVAGAAINKNPGFEDGMANWGVNNGGTGTSGVQASTTGSSGGQEGFMTNSSPGYPTNYGGLANSPWPVLEGETYSFALKAKTSSGVGTSHLYGYVAWYTGPDATGSLISAPAFVNVPGGGPPGTMTQYTAQMVAPATAKSAAIGLLNLGSSSTIVVDDVRAGRVIIADQIGANAVIATKILAGAVTTEKLTVGSLGDNAVLNGDFEEVASSTNMPAGWVRGGWSNFGNSAAVYRSDDGTSKSGICSVVMPVSATTDTGSPSFVAETAIPVIPGEQWYVSCWAKADVATGGGLYVRMVDQNGTEFYSEGGIAGQPDLENEALTTSYVKEEGVFTIPSGVRTARIFVLAYGPAIGAVTNVRVDAIEMRKVTVTAQMGNGAVSALKMAANSVTAANAAIENLAVINAKIASVDAGKISTSTLTADITVSGRVMTAGSGARVEMNSSGVQAFGGAGTYPRSDMIPAGFYHYDGSGVEDFAADSSGVRVRGTITGSTFQSSATGERLVIAAGQARVSFQTNNNSSQASYMDQFLDYGSTGGTESRKTLELHSGIVDATGVSADDAKIYIHSRTRVNGTAGTGLNNVRGINLDGNYVQVGSTSGGSGSTDVYIGDPFNGASYPSTLWANRIKCPPRYARAQGAAAQSIPNASWTVVSIAGSTVHQTGDGFAFGGGGIVVPVKGLYLITCAVAWAANATGQRWTRITVDGTVQVGRAGIQTMSANGPAVHHATALYLQAGEAIRVEAYQNSGGALNTAAVSQDETSFLSVAMLWEDNT